MNPSGVAVLTAENLSIEVAQRRLIAPFDWVVHAGERWAILGANGVGKTRLLHTLLGLASGSSARAATQVLLLDTPLAQLSVQTQAQWRVWVPQRYEEPFTVLTQQAVQSVAPQADEVDVRQHLEQFGVRPDAWVHHLSGGERQRLTWAMAALRAECSQCAQGQTALWLLDEPFAAQDIAWQKRLLAFLRARDAAVVASVHDLNQVRQFATHVLLLGEGQVLAQGTTAQVMTSDLLSRAYGVAVEVDAQGWVHW